jgi:2-methylcitrate dehydratase PrpD
LAVYPEAITYCGNRAPKTPIMGQFSLSYTLAYSLLHGDLTPDAYEDAALGDPALQALEARIILIPDEALGANGKRGCRLTVEAGGGESWSQDVDSAPGDASGPLTDAQLADKVRTFCTGRVPAHRTERLIQDLLEGSPDQPVRGLISP